MRSAFFVTFVHDVVNEIQLIFNEQSTCIYSFFSHLTNI